MQCGEPDGHARGCPASVASPSSAATLSELVAESKRCVERLNQIEADLKRLHGRELGDGNRDVQPGMVLLREIRELLTIYDAKAKFYDKGGFYEAATTIDEVITDLKDAIEKAAIPETQRECKENTNTKAG